MPPDSTETKRRLLAAATEEFARYGLAGARVDRIAEAAGANKRLLYVYFGDKEQLFDRVVADRLGAMLAATPFDVRDLSGYAGALFDQVTADPALLRLITWQRLERPDPNPFETDTFRGRLADLGAAQRAGIVDSAVPAADLLAFVRALATAWAGASPALRALGAEPAGAADLADHRRAVVEAVRRLVTAPAGGGRPGGAPRTRRQARGTG